MKQSTRKWLSFIAFTTFGGVVFKVSLMIGDAMFGVKFPNLNIFQLLLLGNINTFFFAACAGLVGATMGVDDAKTRDR
jgi:cytosine/uracil/thiamine/allantoin permease